MRERGIYSLPDGRQVVSSKGADDMWFLFTLNHWQLYGAVDLRVNPDGTISEKGVDTHWTLASLTDTGRTASPPPTYP